MTYCKLLEVDESFSFSFSIFLYRQEEMGKNPDAVLRAVQFFMYSIKKSPTNMPFKVIPTDEVIQKESNEIENMGKFKTTMYLLCFMQH